MDKNLLVHRKTKLVASEFIKLILLNMSAEYFTLAGFKDPSNILYRIRSKYFNELFDEYKGTGLKRLFESLTGYYVCVDCNIPKTIDYYYTNDKSIIFSQCKDCYNSSRKEYYNLNKERHLKLTYSWRARHPMESKLIAKRCRLNNLDKDAYKSAKRRATKLQATPNWANLIAIKEIYRTCPTGYHVDHIVPLQGKLVCGLHCEFNLQHLPASENLSKGNRFEV